MAVFGDHPTRDHGQHHVAAVLAVHQLLPQIVERGERNGVQVDHGQVGEHARGDRPEIVAARWRGHRHARARSKSRRALAIRSLSSPETLWIRPAVLATVQTLTVSSQIASSVPSATGMPWSSRARHGATPLPSRRLLTGLWTTVDPASAIVSRSASSTQTAWMTLVCGLRRPASAVNWTRDRPANRGCSVIRVRCDLGLQHVRVQREAVALGQVVERGEVVQADALRSGDRDRGADPVVCSAVPGADQMVVGVEQRLPRPPVRVGGRRRYRSSSPVNGSFSASVSSG